MPEEVPLPAAPPPWRPLPRASMHVTLVFLGELAAAEPVAAALGSELPGVGEVSLGGAVLLPPRRPRVLAVRLEDPAGRLAALQAEVTRRLSAFHTPEKRRYLPHVTVGRARGEPGGPVAVEPASFVPRSVTLYRSRLSRTGARYEPLHVVALDAAG